MIYLIVAKSTNNVIGKDNKLLWKLSGDMKHFRETTTGHYVIMGRKTYESLDKPLPNRVNIVVTRDKTYTATGCLVTHSLEEAIELCGDSMSSFIIGGGEIYKEALDKQLVDIIYMTEVDVELEGDTHFPVLDLNEWHCLPFYKRFDQDDKNEYSFTIWEYYRANMFS